MLLLIHAPIDCPADSSCLLHDRCNNSDISKGGSPVAYGAPSMDEANKLNSCRTACDLQTVARLRPHISRNNECDSAGTIAEMHLTTCV